MGSEISPVRLTPSCILPRRRGRRRVRAAYRLLQEALREDHMAEYDLVIRNTTIATAADVVKGDIGISGGRVVALSERLDKGKKEIDIRSGDGYLGQSGQRERRRGSRRPLVPTPIDPHAPVYHL